MDNRFIVSYASVFNQAKNTSVNCFNMKFNHSKKDLFNADIQTVSTKSISPVFF